VGTVLLISGTALLLGFLFRARSFVPSSRWVAALLGLATLPAALYVSVLLLPVESPYQRVAPPGSIVLAADGSVLQRDRNAGLRIPVSLGEMAPALIDATIAAEDQRFRLHPGVDPVAAGRALLSMPLKRSGASTITQQLARRLYLSDDSKPLLVRKAREAFIALQIEASLSKDQILELYLNEVYYGRGAYGIEAAARVYFGVSARNLDLAQAALLAGFPQRPALFSDEPLGASARARQRYVLEQMVRTGKISLKEAAAAFEQPLAVLEHAAPGLGAHFVQYVFSELTAVAPALVDRNDLVIETTLDAGLQAETERLVRLHLERLEEKGVGNAAVVVLNPATGAVLAMVGGRDFHADIEGAQINMATRPRQPGSALKPFLYAVALERGFTAATPLLDMPTTLQTPAGPYTPLNFDRRYRGVVSLRVALASSLNIPAVRTLEDIGRDSFLDVLHRAGLSTLSDAEAYGPALALGSGEVRLLDLTAAYGAFMNEGLLVPPYVIERIRDSLGAVLYERGRAVVSRVTSPEAAFLIADILSDPVARIPGFGMVTPFELPHPTAVKTGTTTEYRDNWAIGVTPARAVGVWVGNTDNQPMRGISGVDGAGPIWRAVMELASQGLPREWPAPPAGVRRATVCATPAPPGGACAAPLTEWFFAGTEPAALGDAIGISVPGPEPQIILHPSRGSVFVLSPELGEEGLLLRAWLPPAATEVEFVLDGESLGPVPASQASLAWTPVVGKHRLEVIVYSSSEVMGRADSVFEVRQR
jgi:penicillin-binding protein 1C